MKKYTRPTVEIVELQSNVNIADVNPMRAATTTYADGTVTTVYNLSMLGGASIPQANS